MVKKTLNPSTDSGLMLSKAEALNIVLAGQANVGKSVIFNHLTGLHQHVGNWPGKTVGKAEGTLHYKGYTIDVLDLPGIYSLTTYSLEETISRDFIALQKPDFVVNVIDATHLERNILFTLQLLELERPMVLSLNMVNLLKEKGIEIDIEELQETLGIPVVPTIAIQGKGITKILDEGIKLIEKKKTTKLLEFGKEVEGKISQLTELLADLDSVYPKRWLAIKLLEKDKVVEKLCAQNPKVLKKAKDLCFELEKIHGHDSSIVVADERCHLCSKIIRRVVKIAKPKQPSFTDKLDLITSHRIWGYPVMIAILGLMFLVIFNFGNWSSSQLGKIIFDWQVRWEGLFGISVLSSLGWSAIQSALALVEIALPYIIPFYLLLFLLEDWGYLARVAFLTDSFMHKVGVHGKASICLMLGFGCNVPACLSCRIMETQRERLITGFLATFIPCSAVTVIILGLVGKYVGLAWAFGLYLLAIFTVFVMGKLATNVLPGEPTELIMEMPDYKTPNLKTIIFQTFFRLKEFIFIAGPLVIISGILIRGVYLLGWLSKLANLLNPITVKWLGLPAICGVLLIFGILRKELILVMLASLLGTANFSQVLTPIQMITLCLVSMFYIPCVATITTLKREFGWQKALTISLVKIFFAITLAGLISKLLGIVL